MIKRVSFTLGCVSVLVLGAGGYTTNAAPKDTNWSQWRGSDGTGVSSETNLPVEWSSNKNIKWKAPLSGSGHSSPIVWGDRVFLTSEIEGEVVAGAQAVKHVNEGEDYKHPDAVAADRHHTFKVMCLARDSGKLLWEKTAYEGSVFDDRHRKSSHAAPTPATEGKYVYAYFGTEGLYCFDFKGNLIWKAMPGPIATLGMGVGTSPLLFENLIILQCDEDNGEKSFMIAYDAKSGKEAWRVPRKIQVSWSTPLLVRTAQRPELIASGNESIISYDPKTGKELWRMKGHESNAVPSPVAGHGMVYVSTGYPLKRTFAVKLGASGELDSLNANIIWRYNKGSAYVPSPILYGDYLYLMTDRGLLTCLEAKTGQVVYEGARLPVPATFTASIVAYEDKLLLTSEGGETFVIKAGAKHEVLAMNSIEEPVYASPAISSGMIFIRGERNLYCITKM
ncbi:MAG: PQQ-binding-like beta-propeller repeat protein [bacterium]